MFRHVRHFKMASEPYFCEIYICRQQQNDFFEFTTMNIEASEFRRQDIVDC